MTFSAWKKPRWWFHIFFTPKIGEMIQFDEHVFQMGWFKTTGLENPQEKTVVFFMLFLCHWGSYYPVIGFIISHHRDPYQPTRMTHGKSSRISSDFFFVAQVICAIGVAHWLYPQLPWKLLGPFGELAGIGLVDIVVDMYEVFLFAPGYIGL